MRSHARLCSTVYLDFEGEYFWKPGSESINVIELGEVNTQYLDNFFQNNTLPVTQTNGVYSFAYHENKYVIWVLNHLIADGYSINLLESQLGSEIDSISDCFDQGDLDNSVIYCNSEWNSLNKRLLTINELKTTKRISKSILVCKNDFLGNKKVISIISEALCKVFNMDLAFTVITNRRIHDVKRMNIVGDLHDEIPLVKYRHKKLDFDSLQEDHNFINSGNGVEDSLIQINYEVQNEVEENIPDDMSCRIDDSSNRYQAQLWKNNIIAINVIESLEKLNIEVETCLTINSLSELELEVQKGVDRYKR